MTPEQEKLLKDHDIEAVCHSPFELEEIEYEYSIGFRQRMVIGTATGTIAEAFINQLEVNQQLDFILVRQKDYIIDLIDKKQYFKAKCCLDLVSELWIANNYEYKTTELLTRLANNKPTPRKRREEDD